MSREIIYRTPADTLVQGFVFIREDNRRVTVEKVYPIGDDKTFVRDDSGTPGKEYDNNHLFIVVSDN